VGMSMSLVYPFIITKFLKSLHCMAKILFGCLLQVFLQHGIMVNTHRSIGFNAGEEEVLESSVMNCHLTTPGVIDCTYEPVCPEVCSPGPESVSVAKTCFHDKIY